MAYESDPIAQKLNELVGSQELYFGLLTFDGLPLAEQALIGTWELANEVYNGGFTQYFHNSSGRHAKPMVGILRSINASRAADILAKALAIAGSGTPWGDEPNFSKARSAMPEELKSHLRDLERDLYDELDNLHLQVFRYMSRNRSQFDVPEDFWKEPTAQ